MKTGLLIASTNITTNTPHQGKTEVLKERNIQKKLQTLNMQVATYLVVNFMHPQTNIQVDHSKKHKSKLKIEDKVKE